MEYAESFTNILSRKGVHDYLSDISPTQKIELRAEQFLNLKILNFIDETLETACDLTKHRKGNILQSKDFRFLIYQKNPSVFSNLDFLDFKILKKNTKKKLERERKNF